MTVKDCPKCGSQMRIDVDRAIGISDPKKIPMRCTQCDYYEIPVKNEFKFLMNIIQKATQNQGE